MTGPEGRSPSHGGQKVDTQEAEKEHVDLSPIIYSIVAVRDPALVRIWKGSPHIRQTDASRYYYSLSSPRPKRYQ
jgi:hypothetical protein